MTNHVQLRYILGHVAPTVLILETSQSGNNTLMEKEEKATQKRSTFRNVRDGFRLIYKVQGFYKFFRAMFIGAVYSVINSILSDILGELVFMHALLKPLAWACSSALLCELHLIFTCATISAQHVPFSSLRRKPGQGRWKRLAIPAFLFGLSQAIMGQIYDVVAMALISKDNTLSSTRAIKDTLAVIMMLSVRFLLLLPTQMTLTLAEASFLPAEIETMVPVPAKGRGWRIGELVDEQRPLTGFKAFAGVLQHLGTAKYWWLVGLHAKKCFVQILFEAAILLCIGVSVVLGIHLEEED